ncbi:UDP-N-acetylmuramoyl-L-alanine--D-glutamate ligase [Oceanisphaera arctica]|uniref:UDP-N-acetylmuramoylalanine--D-glutamate ligase n=1 Tax=Oceanisphaera arctica TaxID=641510 RepID=A0A2P5TNN8_9GAMM|nr:UDP-N-acetylmuramoyl-L-alanine--D-glutamate ligase [Oceanisphaera arctica]PPL17135.1 UDP-N-acetylmuramoylalanine--D-glutamate ligase [Oceanisphaera arctica]GHA04517.1 UDP-N-acetylmuramoylalanine--D-glutamate ligase [Oceanisphaera arctica]
MLPERILIIGLGQTGLSCLRYCLQRGVSPVVMDTRAQPPGAELLPEQTERYFGGLSLAPILAAELIIASPGVALATPELQQALAAGIEVVGDIELFVRECTAPIVAITGSNGKSTVTTLVGEMAAETGIRVGVGGNIGIPALDLLQQKAGQPLELAVLELSSFQLETTPGLRACTATVLNISEDHLDRYDSLAHYRDTKLGIYEGARLAVYNREDDQTRPLSDVAAVSFGLDSAEYGRMEHDGELWLSRFGEPVLPVSALKILGAHNQLNALAAMALADKAGIAVDAQLKVLRRFGGLAHRCQFVAEKNGVRWVNDTKATNVGATLAAIAGIGESVSGRLWLIAGGQGKDQDFGPLVPLLENTIAGMACFGQDSARLLALADNTHEVATLDEAVAWCAEQARPGDWVLLAPACASLDMYLNYQKRGEHFIALVEAL